LKTFTETLYGLTLRHRETYESNASSVKSVGGHRQAVFGSK